MLEQAEIDADGIEIQEFAEFSDFRAEEIPDPQDPETFLRSKLDPAHGDPAHRRYYGELLALRRRLAGAPIEIDEVDERRRLLRFRRGDVELVANFSDSEQDGVPPRTGAIRR